MAMKQKILPQEVLKLIACITMLIDHFGYAIVPHLPVPHMAGIYYGCRIIGRVAFPIYCFLLTEGMRHTRDPKKYILRLGLVALLTELPFDIFFEGGFNWAYQNELVTLTLGAVMILCMQKMEKKERKLLMILPFAILAEFAKSGGGGWGIAMIAMFALFDSISVQTLTLLFVNAAMASVPVIVFGIRLSVQLFAVLAMIPIALYSGKKLTHSKAIQWGFYLFYPMHLLLLRLILGFIR